MPSCSPAAWVNGCSSSKTGPRCASSVFESSSRWSGPASISLSANDIMTSSGPESRSTDVVTVVSIAVLAYALANILHEAIGHGGACVALGGKPLVLSSVHFDCGEESISATARRLVAAAGTVVNFLAAVLSMFAMRIAGVRRPRLAYFLWLFTTINLLMAAGYFLFSGLGNIG